MTNSHLRMDDDRDDGNYLIFFRDGRSIESVNHEERSIFVIKAKEVSIKAPFKLQRETQEILLSDA
ncbi:MAG: hypothetical protein OQK78_02505, partial [Gammaproteobacteria bacterium]|nr:hypothetical protein [Gammaproteobacteria bacterium]